MSYKDVVKKLNEVPEVLKNEIIKVYQSESGVGYFKDKSVEKGHELFIGRDLGVGVIVSISALDKDIEHRSDLVAVIEKAELVPYNVKKTEEVAVE